MDEKDYQITGEDNRKDIPSSPGTGLEGEGEAVDIPVEETGEAGGTEETEETEGTGETPGENSAVSSPSEAGNPREDFSSEGEPREGEPLEGEPLEGEPLEGDLPVESLSLETASPSDAFFTKDFASYTVTEGLLLFIFIILLSRFCIEMTLKLLHWRSF